MNGAATSGRPQHLPSFKTSKIPRWAYEWIRVSRDSLLKMKNEIVQKRWYSADMNFFIANPEYFFYFSRNGKAGGSTSWVYKGGNETVVVDKRFRGCEASALLW